ncbi:MAG: trigger factor [gamma proteobacterium symbiont of Bathyaustriella thionipta]|nr:trigger factor [gamma proteobacterium symbiont of Bathyaustriella thionipta]
MQISVEVGDGLERRMNVLLSKEQLQKTVDQRLKKIAKTARMDGFRPGKVPMSVLRRRYGPGVEQEAFGDLVQSSFYEAVRKEELIPAGEPKIEPLKDAAEGDIGYTAIFEVLPEVELVDFSSLKVEKTVADVSDSDIDAMLEKLRKQRVVWNTVERAATTGDQLTINFKGSIDGEVFEGGTAEDVAIELGSGQMIDGFEAALEGKSAGDESSFDVTFPDDYRAEHLAGKEAHFEVQVTAVAESELPELDEDFAATLGIDEGGVDALRDDIRGNMQRELAQTVNARNKNQVMEALIESHEMIIPASLIDSEAESLRDRAREEMKSSGNSSSVEMPLEVFKDQAKKRVTLGMLIAEIIKQQDMKPDADRVKTAVDTFAASYEKPQEVIDWYYSNKQQMDSVENLVLEDQVVDLILQQADVNEDNKTFDDLMSPAG